MTNFEEEGLYYSILGGMNKEWHSGNSSVLTSITVNPLTNKKETHIIIKDIGGYDGKKSFANQEFSHILPDVRPYLERFDGKDDYPNQAKAEALFFTHMHSDHMDIIPLIQKGYKMPKIYADPIALVVLKNSLTTANIPQNEWPSMQQIAPKDTISFGNLQITVTGASHSTFGVGLWFDNKIATLYDTGDFVISKVPDFYTDLEHLHKLRQSTKHLALFCDMCEGNNEGFSLPLSELQNAYQKTIDSNQNQQIIGIVGGGIYHIIMLADLAAHNGKTLILAGDSYQKGVIDIMGKAGYNLQDMFPNLKIIDSSQKEEMMKVNPDDMLVITTYDCGRGSELISNLNDQKDCFPLSSNPIVVGNESFLIPQQKEQLRQKGGHYCAVENAIAHASAADIANLLRVVEPNISISTHSGETRVPQFNDLITAEGYKAYEGSWGNGKTFHIKGAKVKLHSAIEPLWIGVDKSGRFLTIPQSIEKINAVNQLRDKTNYNRTKNGIKQPIYDGLPPAILNRIKNKEPSTLSLKLAQNNSLNK